MKIKKMSIFLPMKCSDWSIEMVNSDYQNQKKNPDLDIGFYTVRIIADNKVYTSKFIKP